MKAIGPLFDSYHVNGVAIDEVFDTTRLSRPYYDKIIDYFTRLDANEFSGIHEYSKNTFFNQGITFNVYHQNKGKEQIFPFDLFPRIITKKEWNHLEKGVIQRNQALNLFIKDLYHDQKIVKDKIVPEDMILSSQFFRDEMKGFTPPGDIYTHICGTDIIKHSDGTFYVLEDNLRSPSGISYVLANRGTMKRALPGLFANYRVQPVVDYPEALLHMMESVAPERYEEPNCVLLTPGMYNSAFYEHVFLASQMGIQLVEGRDLFVDKHYIYMNTIYGPKKVDVIYRRVDDAFLDPEVFRKDSLLGVNGLMDVYKRGHVTIINAPGTGVADDKAIYIYVPELIKYYLDEEPILQNVRTFRCVNKTDCSYVLDNLDKLVVKPVDESGGYGILMGHKSTKQEREEYKQRILENPRKYIAQPVMSLSLHATFIEDDITFEPRHIDLRIFSLMGNDVSYVCKGGLTRVALRRGNLVVNSSQGGGSKDTWVLGK